MQLFTSYILNESSHSLFNSFTPSENNVAGCDLWKNHPRVLWCHWPEWPKVLGGYSRIGHPGHIKIWNNDLGLCLHNLGSCYSSLLSLLLCQSCPRIWESSHIQTWKIEERRSFWSWLVFHPAMHWQVLLCWLEDSLLWGSSSRNVVKRLCHCQCGCCLLLQSEDLNWWSINQLIN